MGHAEVFYEKARRVEKAGGYDYAIEMYILGLRFEPDNVDAHRWLRDLSLRRKASGGPALGMFDKIKLQRAAKSADATARMLAAEQRLAYDPADLAAMLDVLRNAHEAGLAATAAWIQSIIEARGAQ